MDTTLSLSSVVFCKGQRASYHLPRTISMWLGYEQTIIVQILFIVHYMQDKKSPATELDDDITSDVYHWVYH